MSGWLWSGLSERALGKRTARACVYEPLEVRALCTVGGDGSAGQLLNFVVANNLTNQSSVHNLLSKLDFERLYQSFSTDELLEVLVDQQLVTGGGTLGAFKNTLLSRGVDLTGLLPDGILTALAVAPGGTLLNHTSVQTKATLQSTVQSSDAGALATLDVLSPAEILGLFDGALDTSSQSAVDRFVVYSTRASGTGQADPNSPNFLDNFFPAYAINMQSNAPNGALPAVQAVVNALKSRPAGGRAVYSGNMFGVDGFGAMSGPVLEGYIDPYDSNGHAYDYYFLWMDEWKDIVETRYDTFFHQLRDAIQTQLVNTHLMASVDDALNVYLLDMENSHLSYQSLSEDRRINPNATPQYTFWQELVGDPSVGLAPDPRWLDLKAKLMAAGLTANDLSLQVIPYWDRISDPRVAIWNGVLQQYRTEYLNEAMFEPIKRYFPNIKFTNYDDYERNQLVPTGNYTRFTESAYTVGQPTGNVQSLPLYGEVRITYSPSDLYGTITPSPAPATKIWKVAFTPTYVNGVVTGGSAVFTLDGTIQDVAVGENIAIVNQGAVFIDEDYGGNHTITGLQNVTVGGRLVTQITVHVDTNRVLADYDLTSRLASTISNDAYLIVWRSFTSFVTDLNFVRTMASTSTTPFSPWLNSPTFNAFMGEGDFEHWQENIFHAALSGADDFYYWRISDMGSDAAGNALLSQVLKRLDSLIGYSDRHTVTRDFVDYDSSVVVSGMEAGGNLVWRLTPNPDADFHISQSVVNGISQVTVQVGNGAPQIYRYATLLNPANDPVSGGGTPLGYWIVQTQRDDYIVGSVSEVLSQWDSGGGGLWTNSTVPTTPDSGIAQAGEVGLKFSVDVAGYITGMRFYKSALNTGQHVGSLWDGNGNKLATATFTGETASGWQKVLFDTPVAIQAGRVYFVTYTAPNGHFARDLLAFNAGSSNGNHVWAAGNDIGIYRAIGGSPTGPGNADNFWVDPVFVVNPINSITPARDSSNVAISTAVTVQFAMSMDATTINGQTIKLRDANGGTVAATVQYNASTRIATLTPTQSLTSATQYTVTVRGGQQGVRGSDRLSMPVDQVSTFKTVPATGPVYSLWPDSAPSAVDAGATGPVEVGIKFRSDVDGFATGIRFFKGTNNIGTHVGHLYTTGGYLAGTVTFTNETASGWQTATFANPVFLTANQTYIVSYYAPNGHYSVTSGFLVGQNYRQGPLQALADGVEWGNGLIFTGGAGMPTTSLHGANPWVDVMVTRSFVDSVSPAFGSTNVPITAVVSVHFSTAVDASSLNANTVQLLDPAGNLVPMYLSYDPSTRIATLTPMWALGYRTTFVVAVKGGVNGVRDANGMTQGGTYGISFTTVAAPDLIPPSIDAFSPGQNASNVSRSTALTVRFSEEINPATLSTASVFLKRSDGALISTRLAYNASTRTLTISPNSQLAASTNYVLTVMGGTAGVRDLAGNALSQNFTLSFRTGR